MPRAAPTGIASITTTAPGPNRMGQSEIFPETDYYFGADTFLNDLEYMDMLEAAEDEELFRMLGVNSSVPTPQFPTKEEVQDYAAQKYVDAVADYMQLPAGITQTEAKQAVEDAKRVLVDLNVPRSTIESATNDYFLEGIDTSRGIPGVMGPSISGAISQGIEKGSELFGMGAEGLASLVGADKALSSALLNLPNPGVTFVFDESGRKTPIITGQTPSGTQVGVNVNDPYGITDIIEGMRTGDLDIYDVIGAGGRVITGTSKATSLADDDETKKTGVETGVNVTLGGENGADPATKVTKTTIADIPKVSTTDKTTIADIPKVSTTDKTTIAGIPKVSTTDKATIAGIPKVSTTDKTTIAGIPKVSTTDKTTVTDIPKISTTATDKTTVTDIPKISTTDKTTVTDIPKISTTATDKTTVTDIPKISTTATDKTTVTDIPKISTAELDKILTGIGGRPAVPGGYDVPVLTTSADKIPADKIPADKIPGGGDAGGLGLPEETAMPTGGMRGVATEQAGVADIAMLYDPSLSLAENMARILGKKKNEQADAVDSALMYGGGIVQPTDLNAEIRRIIEGR
jgi:hypothetical protein